MKKRSLVLILSFACCFAHGQQFNLIGLGNLGNVKYFGSIGIEYQTTKRSFYQLHLLGGNFGKASFDQVNMLRTSPYIEANKYGQWWDYEQTILNIDKFGIGTQFGYGFKIINKEKHNLEVVANGAYYLVFDKSYHEFVARNSLVLPSNVQNNLTSQHSAISIGVGANYRYLISEKMGLIVGVNLSNFSSFDGGRYYPSILRQDDIKVLPMIGFEPTFHFGIIYSIK